MNMLESGEKYLFEIPSINFRARLPWVVVPADGKNMRIASLNLIGMVGWNQVLGRAIAAQIKKTLGDLSDVVLFTAVEKALQLSQVVATELGKNQIAVAYNRLKPHMDAANRPVIQVGGHGSITSGEKFLVAYERDVNLLATARKGVVIIDDVVSKGGTVAALATVLDQVRELKSLSAESLKILGIFCVATEGKQIYKIAKRIHTLGTLPPPVYT